MSNASLLQRKQQLPEGGECFSVCEVKYMKLTLCCIVQRMFPSPHQIVPRDAIKLRLSLSDVEVGWNKFTSCQWTRCPRPDNEAHMECQLQTCLCTQQWEGRLHCVWLCNDSTSSSPAEVCIFEFLLHAEYGHLKNCRSSRVKQDKYKQAGPDLFEHILHVQQRSGTMQEFALTK